MNTNTGTSNQGDQELEDHQNDGAAVSDEISGRYNGYGSGEGTIVNPAFFPDIRQFQQHNIRCAELLAQQKQFLLGDMNAFYQETPFHFQAPGCKLSSHFNLVIS
jgi:hypothetical protein